MVIEQTNASSIMTNAEPGKNKMTLSIKEIDMSKASPRAEALLNAMLETHERMKAIQKKQKEEWQKNNQ